MSRVDIPEGERRDCYLYIDEFQNFTTDSFANILSEARKYRLDLIMANQYIEQLGDVVKAAVFGNIGTLIVFRVGATDAEELVKEFTPTFMEEDLVSLPKYEMYLKLMINGIASDPFSARGLAPLPVEEKTGNVEKVIKVTRERYAKEKSVVEDKIMRWHENDGGEDEKEKPVQKRDDNFVPAKRPVERTVFEKKPVERTVFEKRPVERITVERKPVERTVVETPRARVEEKRENPKNKEFEIVCSRCSRPTKISFQPDGIRPVYCKDCLSFLREEKRNEVESRKKSKQEELKRIDEQEKNVPKIEPAEKELSLGELSKIKPVGFKNAGEERGSQSRREEGGNLKEGEEVKIG